MEKRDLTRGLIKNKEISKLLKEAIDSPVGSTKRLRAQKILSILNKTTTRLDGTGGPGPRITRKDIPLQREIIDYSNLVVFPAAPKIRTPFGSPAKPRPQTNDGQGGPGGYWNPSYTPTNMTPNRNMSLATPNISSQSVAGPLVAPLSVSAPFMNMSTANSTPATIQQQPKLDLKVTAPATTVQTQPTTQTQTQPQQRTQTQQTTGGTTGGQPQSSGSGTPSATGAGTIQSAVNSGMGPSLFAYQAMSQGADYLKKLPGFAGLPDEALNGAPTFAGRMEEVEKATRQTYRLDELLGQYISMVQEGAGLKTNLTDYIRGRDEFLNDTDSMINKFKTSQLNVSMSNPQVRAQNETYMNYLYELRGRQNKRYIEFLNGAIDEYTGRVTAMSTLYNNALDGYSRELQQKQAITQEEYNLMFGALSDMYTATANAPLQAAEMEKLKAETYAASVRAAKDLAEMNGGNGIDMAKTIANYQKGFAMDEYGRWKPSTYGAEQLATNPESAYVTMMDSVDRTFGYQTDKDGNNITLSLDDAVKTGSNMINHLGNLVQAGILPVEQAEQDAATIQSKMKGSVKSSIGVGNAQLVKDAVNYLKENDNNWWWGLGSTPTRSDLIKNYGGEGQLDKKFLDTLYSDFEYMKDNPSAWGDAFLKDATGSPLDDDGVVDKLAESYSTRIFK